MTILHVALQDGDFVSYSCHASAYIPLLCRFHWHEHQVYNEEIVLKQFRIVTR